MAVGPRPVILAIPALNRPDLLRRCVASIDPAWHVIVVDNSPAGGIADGIEVEVIDVGRNLGVAASWNLVMKAHPDEPWWAFANVDTEFAPDDLDRLAREMAD